MMSNAYKNNSMPSILQTLEGTGIELSGVASFGNFGLCCAHVEQDFMYWVTSLFIPGKQQY